MSEPIPAEAVDEITDNIFAGRKIEAIKRYREHSGKGLKEAKDFVEALEAELRAKEPEKFTSAPTGKGCLGAIVLCAVCSLAVLIEVFMLLD